MAAELEAVQAEAEAGDGSATVPLITDNGRFPVTVLPAGKWRTRANRALQDGDFDTWAELCLVGEGFDAWLEADPTNDDVNAFFDAWSVATGQDQGKSRASRRSSRSTRKR